MYSNTTVRPSLKKAAGSKAAQPLTSSSSLPVNQGPSNTVAALTQEGDLSNHRTEINHKTGVIAERGGHSLGARSLAAMYAGDYKFCLEIDEGEGCQTYSCTGGQEAYAVTVRYGEVHRCTCGDHLGRRRVCKHMLMLAIVINAPLRTHSGAFVAAPSSLLTTPLSQAEMVIALGAVVEAAQAALRLACPRCHGVISRVWESGINAYFWECHDRPGCGWWVKDNLENKCLEGGVH